MNSSLVIERTQEHYFVVTEKATYSGSTLEKALRLAAQGVGITAGDWLDIRSTFEMAEVLDSILGAV